jgi:hypothetical protein
LKEEAIDLTMWRSRFGRGVGPVVRQITEWMNEWWSSSPYKTVCSHVNAVQSFTSVTSQKRSINVTQSVLLFVFRVLNLFHLLRTLLVHEFPLETSEASRYFTSVHRSKIVPHPSIQEGHCNKFSLRWIIWLQQTNCAPALSIVALHKLRTCSIYCGTTQIVHLLYLL